MAIASMVPFLVSGGKKAIFSFFFMMLLISNRVNTEAEVCLTVEGNALTTGLHFC